MYKTGTEALHKINLKINDGEFVFVIGHSGAGKSTMVKLLMCEDIPTEGDVIINGINTKTLSSKKIPKFRRSLGIVFQDFRLIPNLNVFDNIAFAMRVVGKSRKHIKKTVKSVLSLVGLTHKIYDYPEDLSGGEQQRVALARAIVNNPRVIIADEPTGNVDPEMSRDIMNLLLSINKRGITVIVVTHEHEFIREFQKRVVVLEEGEIISDSSASEADLDYDGDDDEDLFFDDVESEELSKAGIGLSSDEAFEETKSGIRYKDENEDENEYGDNIDFNISPDEFIAELEKITADRNTEESVESGETVSEKSDAEEAVSETSSADTPVSSENIETNDAEDSPFDKDENTPDKDSEEAKFLEKLYGMMSSDSDEISDTENSEADAEAENISEVKEETVPETEFTYGQSESEDLNADEPDIETDEKNEDLDDIVLRENGGQGREEAVGDES